MCAAVRRGDGLVAPLMLAPEVLLRHAARDHRPGHQLVLFALAVGVKVRVKTAFLEGLEPAVEGEILLPRGEVLALVPRRFDHPAKAPVAAGNDGLHIARVGIVPVVGDGFRQHILAQQLHAALVLLLGDLRLPLKRRVRLGHEPRGRDRDAHAAVLVARALAPGVHDVGRDLGNAEHILVRLGRKSQHEVELDRAVAAGKGAAAGGQQVLLGEILVDGVAQALRAGLGRKGQAGLSSLLQSLHERHGEVVGAQARQRQADMLLGCPLVQIIQQLFQLSVVRGGQAGKAQLLIAGVGAQLLRRPVQKARVTLTHGAVQKARLTEAAAAHAAAQHLDTGAILNGTHHGHHEIRGRGKLVQVLDDGLGDARRDARLVGGDGLDPAILVILHIVECRDIDAGDLCNAQQQLLFGDAALFLGTLDLHLTQTHLPICNQQFLDDVENFILLHIVDWSLTSDGLKRKSHLLHNHLCGICLKHTSIIMMEVASY